MDCFVVDAGEALLRLDVLKAIRFVPSDGKDVEGDLTTDGESVIVIVVVLEYH